MTAPILKLTLLGGDPDKTYAVACGSCRIVALNEQVAEQCCAPKICGCGSEIPKDSYRTACLECVRKKEAERDAKKVAEAKRVPESEADGLYCGCCDHFYNDSWELLEDHESDDLPTYAWATYEQMLSLDVREIIGNHLNDEGFHESAGEDADYQALQELVDAWIMKNRLLSMFPSQRLVDLTEVRDQYLKELEAEVES